VDRAGQIAVSVGRRVERTSRADDRLSRADRSVFPRTRSLQCASHRDSNAVQ